MTNVEEESVQHLGNKSLLQLCSQREHIPTYMSWGLHAVEGGDWPFQVFSVRLVREEKEGIWKGNKTLRNPLKR